MPLRRAHDFLRSLPDAERTGPFSCPHDHVFAVRTGRALMATLNASQRYTTLCVLCLGSVPIEKALSHHRVGAQFSRCCVVFCSACVAFASGDAASDAPRLFLSRGLRCTPLWSVDAKTGPSHHPWTLVWTRHD
eukprot:Amastigsp_a175813_123.p1 type:complete len:134 gc:universal Amastigsp_a175813_123:372-773(+)